MIIVIHCNLILYKMNKTLHIDNVHNTFGMDLLVVGLGAAAKVDPVQKEREDVRQWLTECIDKLSQEVEQFDAEVESLYAGSKKRKLDRDV